MSQQNLYSRVEACESKLVFLSLNEEIRFCRIGGSNPQEEAAM